MAKCSEDIAHALSPWGNLSRRHIGSCAMFILFESAYEAMLQLWYRCQRLDACIHIACVA
eukprot:55241-Eustigmatos_ZCMA.PRE.1